jgi:hypothetical protein
MRSISIVLLLTGLLALGACGDSTANTDATDASGTAADALKTGADAPVADVAPSCKGDCKDCPSKSACKGEGSGDCANCPSKGTCQGKGGGCAKTCKESCKGECSGDCSNCPSKSTCKGDCKGCAKKAAADAPACVCAKGKAGEPVWCDACDKGYVDGKPAGCKGCVAEALKKRAQADE